MFKKGDIVKVLVDWHSTEGKVKLYSIHRIKKITYDWVEFQNVNGRYYSWSGAAEYLIHATPIEVAQAICDDVLRP
jgi:hypothetical protein